MIVVLWIVRLSMRIIYALMESSLYFFGSILYAGFLYRFDFR